MIAFPFDSHISGYDESGYPIYDRASKSEDIAQVFASFLSDGVFGKGMCTVLAGSGLTATVGVGGGHIKGRFCYIDTPETVTFDAGGSRSRIDTVVLRRDLSSSVNNIVCAVVKGTESSSPKPPALTRDGTVWELGIANVTITAGSTAIAQSRIADTRLDNSRCGLVTAIMTEIDTTGLYNQIQADLAQFQNTEQANFYAWFENLQTSLEGDVAANLTSKVAVLEQSKLEGMETVVALPANGWSTTAPYTQTVAVSGVTAASDGFAAPDDASFEAYAKAMVRISTQGDGTVTFKASKIPASSLLVNMTILSGVRA